MSDVALTASIDLPAGSLGRRGVGWWGLVCAIAGEAALFGYLLFAYYYCRVEIGPDWIPGPLPAFRLALPNTIILLASSATIGFAEQRVRRNERGTALLAMLVTLALGIVFVAVQVLEWRSKTFTIRSHSYGSLYYTITGFHMAHVLVGLVAIALAAIWCARRYFDERRHVPMLIVSAYWHFVDVVWLAVFFTFYVSPRLWSGTPWP